MSITVLLTLFNVLCIGAVAYHHSVVVNKKMYLIGGTYNKQKADTMYKLDLKTFKWDSF